MINQSLLYLLESVLGPSKKKSHNNYGFICPFCKEERARLGKSSKPKLEIQLETNTKNENPWNCWFCSTHGSTLRSLFKKLKINSSKISELNFLVKPGTHIKEDNNLISLPKEFTSLKTNTSIMSKRAYSYLSKRGITEYDIIKYNIGYCLNGEYEDRIIIPSYDKNNNLNYFTARSINDSSSLKYLNPKVNRKDIIGFEFFINWNEAIILCEGVFDAIAIKRNVIPLLGKTISEALMKKIVTSQVKKIYIALDSDALKMAYKHVEMLLSKGKEVYLVELKDKDASQIGFENFTEIIQHTLPITFEDLLIKKLNS